ncbi:MAG: DUF4328 domain-containing protein [Actinomycetota bacterium]
MIDRSASSAGSVDSESGPPEIPYPSARLWARTCTAFLILMAFVFAFSVDFLLPDVRDLPFLRDDLPIAESELRRNHARLVVITKAAVVVGALAAISWLVWQFLAHVNARALSGRKGGLVPALGVVSWVVPGLNLVVPPLVMWGMLRASDPDAVSPGEKVRGRSSLLIVPWWAGWLTGGWLLYIAFRPVIDGNPTYSELMTRDHFAIAASLVGIGTTVLAIVLLHRVNAMQVLKEDRLAFRQWVGWSKSA